MSPAADRRAITPPSAPLSGRCVSARARAPDRLVLSTPCGQLQGRERFGGRGEGWQDQGRSRGDQGRVDESMHRQRRSRCGGVPEAPLCADLHLRQAIDQLGASVGTPNMPICAGKAAPQRTCPDSWGIICVVGLVRQCGPELGGLGDCWLRGSAVMIGLHTSRSNSKSAHIASLDSVRSAPSQVVWDILQLGTLLLNFA